MKAICRVGGRGVEVGHALSLYYLAGDCDDIVTLAENHKTYAAGN